LNSSTSDRAINETGVVRFLLRSNLIQEQDLFAPGFALRDVSRRNSNLVVSVGSGGLFVKRAVDSDSQSSLAREAALYRYCQHARGIEAMSGIQPTLLRYDSRQHILVSRLAPGSTDLEQAPRLRRTAPPIARWLGHSLGRVHMVRKLPRRFALPIPWPFVVLAPTVSMVREMTPSEQALIGLAQGDPELVAGLDTLRAEWRPACLTHGDVKAANIVVPRPRRHRTGLEQPLLVDWEHGGFGDPAWDIAGVLASYLILMVIDVRGRRVVPTRAPVPTYPDVVRIHRAAHAFWTAYRETGFEGTDADGSQGLLARAGGFLAPRLVQYGLERARYEDPMKPQTAQLIQVASNIIRYPLEAVRAMLGLSTASSR
jgi:hypothetical protein